MKNINEIMKSGYTIRCTSHTYVTLEKDGKHVCCYDNDIMKVEEIIYRIEERTGIDFRDIPIKGVKDDFSGLLFFRGGWKRDFWNEFPDEKEIQAYMNLKKGMVKGGNQ